MNRTMKAKESRGQSFKCYCGATFRLASAYWEHKKMHSEMRNPQTGMESKPDAQRPREQGQTEEERHAWLHAKDSRNIRRSH
jgi:hypothetical protein